MTDTIAGLLVSYTQHAGLFPEQLTYWPQIDHMVAQ